MKTHFEVEHPHRWQVDFKDMSSAPGVAKDTLKELRNKY